MVHAHAVAAHGCGHAEAPLVYAVREVRVGLTFRAWAVLIIVSLMMGGLFLVGVR